MANNRFKELFKVDKPIIGMIHLAGDYLDHKVAMAMGELKVYEDAGIDGAIIENYHADYNETLTAIKRIPRMKLDLILGTNILGNPYVGLSLAGRYGLNFVQFDNVQERDLDGFLYENMRKNYPEAIVLGGVGFKYTEKTGNKLEDDLECAKTRCEAIVTTGIGTGIETPLDKLKQYKEILGDFPLIVGAGTNVDNIREQLEYADGAIVGSYFKYKENTRNLLIPKKVYNFMNVVKDIRGD